MELEADQFAMYVLKQANRRLTAGTDLIVRLHRGAVPAPVRQGDSWAGYLDTHPADDYRLAAMQTTLDDIRRGSIRPLTKEQAINTMNRQKMCAKIRRKYPDCSWLHGGLIDFSDCPRPGSIEANVCK